MYIHTYVCTHTIHTIIDLKSGVQVLQGMERDEIQGISEYHICTIVQLLRSKHCVFLSSSVVWPLAAGCIEFDSTTYSRTSLVRTLLMSNTWLGSTRI